MRSVYTLLSVFFFFTAAAQDKDEKEIRDLLSQQTRDWNKGNIDAFMSGYWKNDSLMFIGQNGLTYGYQQTNNNYKRNYSDTAKMGQLTFDILHTKRLSQEFYFIVGKFFLKRTVGDLSGHFTLLFRKVNGSWVIIADHSS